ncbi:MAG: universal stress protein [Halobacteriales archaeon]|nr:universal stress protein [Halobacteriales archaeon]
MTTFLAAVDKKETAEYLLEYLRDRIDDGDTIYAVNSQRGGDDTSDDEVADGKAALDQFEEVLGAEGHQLVRGNSPQEDIMQFARDHDVDELVIAIRKRSPTGKMLFGSTAQDLLLETDRPVVTVPRQR